MLAARFPGILPALSEAEALEVAAIHSVSRAASRPRAGASGRTARRTTAPRRAALVGGGALPRPGEISLAHHGVLFLDELPEFDRDVLEALREPLECGRVSISRAARQAQFPARFQLVAAMNPCPCGHCGDRSGRCRCTPERIARYRGRVSGPARRPHRHQARGAGAARSRAGRAGRGRGLGSDPRRASSARGEMQISKAGQSRTRCSARARSTGTASPTARATSCCATPLRGCCFPRAPITACCAWRAPSPISRRKARIAAEHIAEAIQYRRLDASF